MAASEKAYPNAEDVRALRDEAGIGLLEAKSLLMLQHDSREIEAVMEATLEEKVDFLLGRRRAELAARLEKAEAYLPVHLRLKHDRFEDDDPAP